MIDFEKDTAGAPPTGFITALTGSGKAGVWVVVEDRTAPSGHLVQAANTLGISRAAVHKAIQQKRLAAQRYGKVLLVDREAVQRYKRERPQGGNQSASSRAKALGGASTRTAVMARGR